MGGVMAATFDKLVEAIHYVCSKAGNEPERLDQIKLNKILWYSDAKAYMTSGQPITGVRYIKKPFGPVPSYNRVAVETLEGRGVLRRGQAVSGTGSWNTHFDVIEDYEPNVLHETERGIIDDVYSVIVEGHTSMSISESSHGGVWMLADNDEELPLYTVFAEKLGAISDAHMELAREGLPREGL